MSAETETVQQPATPASRMIMVLTGIAMLSGFLVVLTSQLTAARIAENQRIAVERAVSEVIPGRVFHKEFQLVDNRLVAVEKGVDAPVIYAGYDANGKLLGIATKSGAQGYAGMIYLLYGYDHKCQCVRGFKVLKMAETPGLGDKIITDDNFQANFDALDVRLNQEKTGLANPVILVKPGTRKHAWEIDGISGATISSRAVARAIQVSAQDLLPRLVPLLHLIEEAEQ